jgi:hypothetical protein
MELVLPAEPLAVIYHKIYLYPYRDQKMIFVYILLQHHDSELSFRTRHRIHSPINTPQAFTGHRTLGQLRKGSLLFSELKSLQNTFFIIF